MLSDSISARTLVLLLLCYVIKSKKSGITLSAVSLQAV